MHFIFKLKDYHHHLPCSLLHSSLAGSQKSTGLTEQALIHCFATSFLSMWYVLLLSAVE
jgi:hypothetical protein